MRPCLCQPPSGGCVLKRCYGRRPEIRYDPAAFGRLCVETSWLTMLQPLALPAAFGRLCVETVVLNHLQPKFQPAAFGRLCVETS